MRNSDMMTSSFNLILSIYLSLVFPPSHGSEAVEPVSCTVIPDGVTFISCEHTAEASTLVDVRLNSFSPADKTRDILCQKGSERCQKNVYMMPGPENATKWLFFTYKFEPKGLYECEFTVDVDGLDKTWREKPAPQPQGQREVEKGCPPAPSPSPSPAPATRPDPMGWVLIGLVALLLLCVGVIVCLYIRLRKSKAEHDSGTYVEMRKAPLARNAPAGVYCGN